MVANFTTDAVEAADCSLELVVVEADFSGFDLHGSGFSMILVFSIVEEKVWW